MNNNYFYSKCTRIEIQDSSKVETTMIHNHNATQYTIAKFGVRVDGTTRTSLSTALHRLLLLVVTTRKSWLPLAVLLGSLLWLLPQPAQAAELAMVNGATVAQPASVDSSSPNIEIIISSVPKSIQNFVFSGELGNFSLDNPEKEDKDGVAQSQKFSAAADVYTISQAKLTLWELSDITCEGNQDAVQIDLGKRSVTITASEEGKITCTFHNKRLVNLEGIIFDDVDGDGFRGVAEPYMANWEVTFYDSEGNAVASDLSNNEGKNTIHNLKAGLYKICQSPQTSWSNSLPFEKDLQLGKYCYSVMVMPGQKVEALFGNTQGPVDRSSGSTNVTYGINITSMPDVDENSHEEIMVESKLSTTYLPLITK